MKKRKCEKCGEVLSKDELDHCEDYKDFPSEVRYICDACCYSEEEENQAETFSDADPGL